MPSWKRVITSGSAAALSSLLLTDGLEVTGSVQITGSLGLIGPLAVSSSQDSYVIGSGNVGIGTTTPQTFLTLNGANVSYAGQLQIASNDFAQITFYTSAALTPGASNRKASLIYNIGSNTFEIANQITNGALILQGSDSGGGNVGIGTDSPASKLDVNGDISITVPNTNTSLLLKRDVSGTVYTYGSLNNAGSDFNINGTGNVFINADSDSDSTSTDRNVTFGNRGVEYMRVRYDGNVGIGTTAPKSTLNIAQGIFQSATILTIENTSNDIRNGYEVGRINFYSNDVSTSSTGIAGAIRSIAEVNDGQYYGLAFNVKSLSSEYEAMRITNAGNVGIGTTSPGTKLDIGFDANNRSLVRLNSNAANRMAAITFYGNSLESGTIGYEGGSEIVSGGVQGDLVIRNHLASKNIILITNGGNVGIGTTAPTWKLQAESSSSTVAMFRSSDSNTIVGIDNSAADGDPQLKFYINDIGTFTLGVDDSDSDKFKIGTSDLTTNTRLTIDGSGNVGIGTASPNVKLEVNGGIRTTGADGNIDADPLNGAFRFYGPGGFRGGLYNDQDLTGGTGSIDDITTYTSAGSYHITVGAASNKILTASGSAIGIGTITPTQPLHVAGNTRIEGSVYDSTNSAGTSGQVLSSTVTGTQWIAAGSGTIGGSGTTNYVSKFTGGTTLGNSLIYDNGTNVGIGTTAPVGILEVAENGGGTWTSANKPTLFISNAGTSNAYYALGIKSNSGEIFSITNAGNVGIGTTTPGTKLEIDQSANTYTSGFSLRNANNVIYGLYVNGSNDLSFQYQGSDKVTFQSGGNVGIGTSSPAGKLHISGDGAAANQIRLQNTGAGTNGFFDISVTSTEAQLIANYSITAIPMLFLTGAAERMRITSAGNVGIGTTSPSYKLHVEDANPRILVKASSTGFAINYLQNDGGTLQTFIDNSAGGGFGFGNYVRGIYSTGAYDFITATNATERMRITSAGNVGIGTSSPTGKLQVNTSSAGANALQLGVASQEQYVFETGISGVTNGALIIKDSTTPYTYLTLRGGNVGIGTTSPDVKFQVQGGAVKATTSNYASPSTGGAISMFQDSNDYGTIWAVKDYNGGWANVAISPLGGNVGIGTTSPSEILHIKSSAPVIRQEKTGILNWYSGNVTGNNYTIYPDSSTNAVFNITSAGNVGIGTTSPSAKLDVEGDINIINANISNQEGTIPIGTTTVASVSSTTYSSMAIDYVVKNGLNLRSGTIIACHDGTSTVYTETSTPDIGSTTDITFAVAVSGADFKLEATVLLAGWTVKTLVRAL